jgi:hypothetical protein
MTTTAPAFSRPPLSLSPPPHTPPRTRADRERRPAPRRVVHPRHQRDALPVRPPAGGLPPQQEARGGTLFLWGGVGFVEAGRDRRTTQSHPRTRCTRWQRARVLAPSSAPPPPPSSPVSSPPPRRLGRPAAAFAAGMSRVLPLPALRLFSPAEFNQLLSGGLGGGVDVEDWRGAHIWREGRGLGGLACNRAGGRGTRPQRRGAGARRALRRFVFGSARLPPRPTASPLAPSSPSLPSPHALQQRLQRGLPPGAAVLGGGRRARPAPARRAAAFRDVVRPRPAGRLPAPPAAVHDPPRRHGAAQPAGRHRGARRGPAAHRQVGGGGGDGCSNMRVCVCMCMCCVCGVCVCVCVLHL